MLCLVTRLDVRPVLGRAITRQVFSLALMLGVSMSFPAFSQAPAGYYNSVDSSSAAALRASLHDVIDDHTRYPYSSSTQTDTWDILNLADEDPNNTSNILDIYKNASYTKITGGTGVYNREHSWPKSYGFPTDDNLTMPYTDCHHLFASDTSYNADRGNKPFRGCSAGCTELSTLFNDGRGGGSGVYPGNSNWTSGDFSFGTWEVWNSRKGDIARAIFYMDIRYEGGTHGITGVDEPDLRLTNDDSLIDAFRSSTNTSVAYMGILTDLLAWHQADPPDDRERIRNGVVFAFQGNRNPFVDHPEWVDCLYGTTCSTGTGSGQVILSEVFYDPVGSDSGLEWVELVNIGTGTVDLSGYSLGNGGSNYAWSRFQLSGSIAPGQVLVVGGPTSSSTNFFPAFHQAGDFNPDFQNSGSTADGVALFDRPASQVTSTIVPVDAVVYGTNNSNGLIDETGSAHAPEVGDAPSGWSIERVSLAGAWQLQSSPNPNVSSLGGAVNTAPSVSITSPASGSSTTFGTSLSLSASATDAEDGGLGSAVVWSSSLDGSLGAGATISASLSVGNHTITAAATDSGGLSANDSIAIVVDPAPVGGSVLLSEVFYDPVGSDSGLEWVELVNVGSTSVDLSGYSLGNGGTNYAWSRVQLSGILAPGAVYVVGGPTSSSANRFPSFSRAIDFNPDFQNSGSTADGVALFDVPAAQVTSSTVPVDAVVYGSTNSNGLIDETGVAKAPEVGDAPSGSSIERLDVSGAWRIQSSPSPNTSIVPR